MEQAKSEKPTKLTIEYPDRQLDRLTTFFRPIVAIPILIVLGTLSGAPVFWEGTPWGWGWIGQWDWQNAAAFVVVPTALMIIFRRKYPRWWFDWNLNMAKFVARVFSYMALMTDTYPSTDDEQGVNLDLHYPEVSEELTSWMPLVKWFLAIPHYIVLFFLNIASTMVVIIAWFAIMFTGRYPKGLFDFVVKVYHWNLRVLAYAFLLITDKYPAFDFNGWE
ncbi:MAG: DUF4389 domain-containing protein [Candidatus Bipolaricaulota bacterium]|nr:DUF4389 domain-containing protein [Candidatus Bipolaricaulota bacterium]MBS3792693.1 DUF4389 domain-containing protein [Candidatus Bipolaricaulota bacterium]